MIQLLNEQTDFIQNYRLQGKSANTLKNYQQDLNCFNKFALEKFKGLSLVELKIDHVQEYDNYLTNKQTKDNSRRRRIQTLRLFADHLMKKGKLTDNPVRKLAVSPKKLSPIEPSSFADIHHLLHDLFDKFQLANGIEKLLVLRNLNIISLIYEAGLKVSELEQLKFKHFLFAENEMRILVEHPKRDPISVKVPVNLKKYFDEYVKLMREKDLEINENQYFLFNANHYSLVGQGLSARGIELLFKELTKKLVKPMTPKSLRQSCIIHWIMRGETDQTIRDWMGVMPNYSLQMYRDYSKNNPLLSEQFISPNWETLWIKNL